VAEEVINEVNTTEENVADALVIVENENQKAVTADDSNAEEGRRTIRERHEIPMLEYETLSMEALVDELQELVATDKVLSIKTMLRRLKAF
jgi:hypothetical protein